MSLKTFLLLLSLMSMIALKAQSLGRDQALSVLKDLVSSGVLPAEEGQRAQKTISKLSDKEWSSLSTRSKALLMKGGNIQGLIADPVALEEAGHEKVQVFAPQKNVFKAVEKNIDSIMQRPSKLPSRRPASFGDPKEVLIKIPEP